MIAKVRSLVANGVLLAVSVAGTLLSIEASLRLQQRIGPIIPLANLNIPDNQSDVTHHRIAGQPDSYAYKTTMPAICPPNSTTVRIVFLGDSWMEEGGIPQGVADYASSKLGPNSCLEMYNGGVASFAPSPMLIKGELLIGKIHPDLLIANIDETDLMDETIRYKDHLIRNQSGQIDRVSPERLDALFRDGLLQIERHPTYIGRLLAKAYHTHIFMPQLARLTTIRYETLLAPQLSSNPRATHAAEIQYFEGILDEFLNRMSKAMGGADRVLVTHHPHYLGIDELGTGRKYNNILSDILRQHCTFQNVPLYEAQSEFRELYGANFAHFFLWPKDPFSHLTHEGYLRYGYFIGRRIFPRLQALLAQQAASPAVASVR